MQESLTRALGKLHLWQAGTDLRAWLFTILHNQYVSHVRRAVREGVAVGLSDSEPLLTRAPQQNHRLELRDLERAIAKLPSEQRQVILLIGLEGMRYEEVAAILGVPVGTVRSRLSRARQALRRNMGFPPEDDGKSGLIEDLPSGTFAGSTPVRATGEAAGPSPVMLQSGLAKSPCSGFATRSLSPEPADVGAGSFLSGTK